MSRDGRTLAILSHDGTDPRGFQFDRLDVLDLASGASRRITTHGQHPFVAALDGTGQILVTGDFDGLVRVGRATGGEPHLLPGHTAMVESLAVSPDGRWIASVAGGELFLWPMPDLAKPPLHTLPHDQLLSTLDALTNLRVVADQSSATGWTLDLAPFPGWKKVPTW
jgi:WD40 repeat protein